MVESFVVKMKLLGLPDMESEVADARDHTESKEYDSAKIAIMPR